MDPTTPRPWRIGPYPGHVENSAARLVAGCNGHTNNVRDETSTNHANAELIVTAVNSYSEAREAAFCKLVSAATVTLQRYDVDTRGCFECHATRGQTHAPFCSIAALRAALKAVEETDK